MMCGHNGPYFLMCIAEGTISEFSGWGATWLRWANDVPKSPFRD
jgi:hypothetical protein